MELIIFVVFLTIIVIAVLMNQKDDVTPIIEAYKEPNWETEALLRKLDFYRRFTEDLDSKRNQGIITQEEYETDRAEIQKRLDEIECTLPRK